jgi:hypothetical protein
MSYLNDRVYDNGLGILQTEVTAIHICSSLPATYAEATSTYSLGSKSSPTVSAPQAGSPDGRQVTVSAISDGTVSDTGTAGFVAGVDVSGSRLLYARALASTQAVTDGNPFTLTSHTIRIPAPA